MEMEDELNYLSNKIEELEYDRDYNEREGNKAEDQDSMMHHNMMHHNMMCEKLNTEIDLLETILTAITSYTLS